MEDSAVEMEYFYRLNVIEPSCEVEAARPQSKSLAGTGQASGPVVRASSGPVVKTVCGLPLVPLRFCNGAAAAAASRVCAQRFGSSHSIFHFGAAMSYLLGGSARDVDVVQSMALALPSGLRHQASEALSQLARAPGMKLMGAPSSPVVHATQQIRSHLNMNSSVQFYIGITERPGARFEEHKAAGGYSRMRLYVYPNSRESGAAERALISTFQSCPECRNIGKGNERASAGSPHYLYIVWSPRVWSVRG